jgi:hypothetical protein
MPTSLSSTTSSAKLQSRVGHGVAAVLDDQRLAVELADVGQRLGQDLGLLARRDPAHVNGLVGGGAHGGQSFTGEWRRL